jgi:catechol 2,3-dioxygenase-like lactoylglutathione lyase family enzyme
MNLNQVTVPSRNLKASVDFYRQLGLKLIVDSIPEYARFECPDGESTLSVQRVDRIKKGSGVVIYFECGELDHVVTKLKADGLVFDSDPVDQRWLWREAHLHDPDGNAICLFHAGSNRRHPPWRVP